MKASRCLLIMMVSGVSVFQPSSLLAQVDCFGEPMLSVGQLHGKVIDPLGEALASSDGVLIRGEEKVSEFKTDSNGEFWVKAAPGKYKIHVRAPGFATGYAFVNLGSDVSTMLRSPRIFIVLGIGEWRPCPSATTSKKQLNRILSDYSPHAKRQ